MSVLLLLRTKRTHTIRPTVFPMRMRIARVGPLVTCTLLGGVRVERLPSPSVTEAS